MVRSESGDKRVLNLFCYTGSFSVYAVGGNAASVTSVDLSKTYLEWAKDNFIINRFKDEKKFTSFTLMQHII
jgi:23S rRNA (cytosine1962-C5)-methyltransferase